MAITGHHIKNKKGMSHWENLLQEWKLAIEKFCRITDGSEAPYWYNERANVGTLAGAAWRSGLVALEEFQYIKGYKNKPKWLGRADLWLASEHHTELIEAKFDWCSLKSRNCITKKVQALLDLAENDAKKSRGASSDIKATGAAFVAFYIGKREINNLDKLINEVIESVKNCNYHAIGWCFPKQTRNILSEKGNILPGVVILAKNVDVK